MSKAIKLQPTDKQKTPVEEKQEEEIEVNEELLLPEKITNRESDYILNQIANLITIYYSANQLGETPIPKNSNWYLNELLSILKEFNILKAEM